MNETVVVNAYIVISIIIAATDILLAVKSFKKNKTTGRFLGFACMGAAIVDISYLIRYHKWFLYVHGGYVEYIFYKYRFYACLSFNFHGLFHKRKVFRIWEMDGSILLFILYI